MEKAKDQSDTSNEPESYLLLCLNAYVISNRILSGNAAQLRQLVKTAEDSADPQKIWIPENKKARDDFLSDLMRHFHNFLTSVTTLIDHTRHLMQEDFITEKHRKEHQERIDRTFATDPMTLFIK
jgi:hypothetical protein